MNKIRTIIIEDEIPAARLLYSSVTKLRPEWSVEIVPGSVDEAIEWFKSHDTPDLIFLDINLSDGDAFDLLTAAKPKSAIIFTTAYDQYAVRAFTVNSIDYILKPVDEQRLADALAKYEGMYQRGMLVDENYLNNLLDTLMSKGKKYRNRFMISDGTRFWSLQVENIAYFYSEDKITYAVTANGREHVIDLSLSRLEEQLDPEKFFRINRQMILNIDAIEHARTYSKGKIKIVVNPPFKTDIFISDSRLAAFRLWLNY